VEQRLVFDRVAERYDRARPGYPEELYDEVVSAAGLAPGSRLLEIGCGPGQATRGFARRGFCIVALEPGPRLAALARRNLADVGRVEVVERTFEEFECEPGGFDLVYSGQAFHWVAPEVRFAKTARVLRPGGTLAIFGWRPTGHGELREELDRVYASHAPEVVARLPGTGRSASPLEADCAASGAFGPVRVRDYARRFEYTPEQYADLLGTQSDHLMLGAERLAALLGGVRAVLARHGDRVRVESVCRLWLARVATA
jgi:SAM-dependent methyltransferase